MSYRKKIFFKYIFFILLLLLLFSSSVLLVKSRSRHPADSDFFSFWLASKMLFQNQNLYDTKVWTSEHISNGATWIGFDSYLYPPTLAILTAPISLLSVSNGFIVWVFLSIISTFLAIYLIFSNHLNPTDLLKYLFPFIFGVCLFRPFLVTLIHGQISAFLFLISVTALINIKKKSSIYGGFLLGLLILKPSIGLIILCLVGIWGLVNRNYSLIIGLLLSGLSILFLSSIIMPGWINPYFSILISKGNQILGLNPTLWGLFGITCSYNETCTLIAGSSVSAILLILVSSFLILKGRYLTPYQVFSLSISTSLLVTPYAWAYDQLLLFIPIIFLTLPLIKRGKSYLFSSTLPIMFSLLSVLLAYVGTYLLRDIASILLSVLIFISTIIICFIEIQSHAKQKNKLNIHDYEKG